MRHKLLYYTNLPTAWGQSKLPIREMQESLSADLSMYDRCSSSRTPVSNSPTGTESNQLPEPVFLLCTVAQYPSETSNDTSVSSTGIASVDATKVIDSQSDYTS